MLKFAFGMTVFWFAWLFFSSATLWVCFCWLVPSAQKSFHWPLPDLIMSLYPWFFANKTFRKCCGKAPNYCCFCHFSTCKLEEKMKQKQQVSNIFLIFTPTIGKKIQFDEHIFWIGLVQPPTRQTIGCLLRWPRRSQSLERSLELPQRFASSSHGGCRGCRGIWKTLDWIPWEIGVTHQMLKKPFGIGFKSLDVHGCLPISTGYSNANRS